MTKKISLVLIQFLQNLDHEDLNLHLLIHKNKLRNDSAEINSNVVREKQQDISIVSYQREAILSIMLQYGDFFELKQILNLGIEEITQQYHI